MSLMTWIAVILLGLVATSCSTVTDTSSPSASVCDGIDAQMGGCDDAQPEFEAADCAGVGQEFGVLLDRQTRQIIEGPEAVGGEARSVRLRQSMVLLSGRANDHLRDHELHTSCDVPEFLAAAEAQFSPQLKERVGTALYDNAPPATFEEWKAELTLMLGIIDAEESGG